MYSTVQLYRKKKKNIQDWLYLGVFFPRNLDTDGVPSCGQASSNFAYLSLSTFRLVLLLLLQSKKQLDLICFEEENCNLSFPQKSFVFLKNKLEPKEKRRCKIFVICLFPQRRGCWPP